MYRSVCVKASRYIAISVIDLCNYVPCLTIVLALNFCDYTVWYKYLTWVNMDRIDKFLSNASKFSLPNILLVIANVMLATVSSIFYLSIFSQRQFTKIFIKNLGYCISGIIR